MMVGPEDQCMQISNVLYLHTFESGGLDINPQAIKHSHSFYPLHVLFIYCPVFTAKQ